MYSIIPENYLETGVVPICISDVDNFGRAVFTGWIEAVPRVPGPVRNLARKLGDVWLASQLAEESVHQLSANHGEGLGPAPSSATYIEASWRTAHIMAGGRREYEGVNIQRRDVMLACLREPYNFARAYEDAEYFDRLLEELQRRGMVDAERIVNMYLAEAEDQIPAAFGIETKASTAWQSLCKRFLRSVRRAAGSL